MPVTNNGTGSILRPIGSVIMATNGNNLTPGMGEIIQLNVGGTRFSTSRQTLMWIPDSFFSRWV